MMSDGLEGGSYSKGAIRFYFDVDLKYYSVLPISISGIPIMVATKELIHD